MKLLTKSGLAGTLSVTDGLSGVGPPPGLTRSHVFAIWMYPGAPLLSPLLRMRLRRPFRKIETIARRRRR